MISDNSPFNQRFDSLITEIEQDESGREFLMQKAVELCKKFTAVPFSGEPTDFRLFFEKAEKEGIHILKNHFYNPIPDTEFIENSYPTDPSPLKGVLVSKENHLYWLKDIFSDYIDELKEFTWSQPVGFLGSESPKFYMDNTAFSGTDAFVTYCYLRHTKPEKIIEVGSGFSTLLMSLALEKNGHGEIICIEPHPHWFLEKNIYGLKHVEAKLVQDVEIDLFKTLKENDLLFVDSTHISKFGSDVNHLFFNVFPELNKGVHVHLHDIYLPWEVPKRWMCEDKIFWNEQYLLHAFLQYNKDFKVKFSNSYAAAHLWEEFKDTFPTANWHGGGTIFMERIDA